MLIHWHRQVYSTNVTEEGKTAEKTALSKGLKELIGHDKERQGRGHVCRPKGMTFHSEGDE